MTLRRFLPLALLTSFALGSCEKDGGAAPAASLLEARWMLTYVDEVPVQTSSYSGTARSYIEFSALGNSTVGLGPCNNFSGRFSLGGGQQLQLSMPIPTQTSCPVQALETRYLNNLAATTRYEISGDALRLYDGSTVAPRLVFRRAGQ
ncbi:META domain-containing protein [Hymenobacter properus]|uniref:META domain-containing protein n=1 Tax=Hymenobacter properus TaxID=2791026 RepID=A0A931BER7_9BACT|nr:META domain-containing protein [Hymenobacter properus]MBF9142550.1 META domain-containing protein [Hymenobacter properus]MBR7721357.1 META domain-containing protein [Microvirga sp. SRT04]